MSLEHIVLRKSSFLVPPLSSLTTPDLGSSYSGQEIHLTAISNVAGCPIISTSLIRTKQICQPDGHTERVIDSVGLIYNEWTAIERITVVPSRAQECSFHQNNKSFENITYCGRVKYRLYIYIASSSLAKATVDCDANLNLTVGSEAETVSALQLFAKRYLQGDTFALRIRTRLSALR